MENLSRRQFNTSLLSSFFTSSLVETLCSNELLAKPIHVVAKDWLVEVEEASQAMRKRTIVQSEWQNKIAEIFAHVAQQDLLRAIDCDRLRKRLKLVGNHEAIIEVEPRFQPTGEVAYTFNSAIYRIDRARKFGGRQFYVDAAHGEKVDGDKLRVKKLSSEGAYKIYSNA